MHHLTSKSADQLSDELHRLAAENSNIPAAQKAFTHAAKLLNDARLQDFAQSPERKTFKQEPKSVPSHDFLRV